MLNCSFWRSKRVLLTGHTGFKGSWLSLWLTRLGAEVWGYSLPTDGGPLLFNELGSLRYQSNFTTTRVICAN